MAAQRKKKGGRNTQDGEGLHGFMIYMTVEDKEQLARAATAHGLALGPFIRMAATMFAEQYPEPSQPRLRPLAVVKDSE